MMNGNIAAYNAKEQNEEQKKAAALRACREIQDGMVLGLGTGSTVYYLILRLAELIQQGMEIHAVATSIKTEELASRHNIPLLPMDRVDKIHLAIDGVDAIDPDFYSIKGGGGALFREKVIAASAQRVIWIMDQSKLAQTLNGMILPVEVSPFACGFVQEQVRMMGFEPVLRCLGDGKSQKRDVAPGSPGSSTGASAQTSYITDNRNYILDLKGNGHMDYRDAAGKLKCMTGVLETGLFHDLCQKIIVGTKDGVVEKIHFNI